jgi:hypothetical protein
MSAANVKGLLARNAQSLGNVEERTEAQKEAQRNYYLTKLKNDPVYQAKQRESSNQEVVKEKVRNYKKEKKNLKCLKDYMKFNKRE